MLRNLYLTDVTRCTRDGEAYMAVLREVDGPRMLPVLMDADAARRLLLQIQGQLNNRLVPSLAGIVYQMFRSCAVRLLEVRICGVQGGITYCHLLYEHEAMERVVRNCRAADGLLLACTFGCPVCIDEELLERQSMHQVGETSYSMPANSVSTEALQGALQQAIREENYELAAQLRDELLRRK